VRQSRLAMPEPRSSLRESFVREVESSVFDPFRAAYSILADSYGKSRCVDQTEQARAPSLRSGSRADVCVHPYTRCLPFV
jgi:hypothetical protein